MFQTHSTPQSQKRKSIFYVLLSLSLCIFLCHPSLHFTPNQITSAYSSPRCVTWCAFSERPVNAPLGAPPRGRGEAIGGRAVWMPLRPPQLTAVWFLGFLWLALVSLLCLLASLFLTPRQASSLLDHRNVPTENIRCSDWWYAHTASTSACWREALAYLCFYANRFSAFKPPLTQTLISLRSQAW